MLVRLFLDRWESDPAGDALLVLLRSAVTNEHAAARMRADLRRRRSLPRWPPRWARTLAARRAGLVSAQLLGLGLTRYLLRLPAVTALSPRGDRGRPHPGHPGHPCESRSRPGVPSPPRVTAAAAVESAQ